MDKLTVDLHEQLRIATTQRDQLESENIRVVDQLKEVIKMNTHWQRYDSQREDYVLKLTRTNQELQDKVSDRQRQIKELSNAKRLEIQKTTPRLKESAQLKEEQRKDGNIFSDTPEELQNTLHTSFSSHKKEEKSTDFGENIAYLKDRIIQLEKERDTNKKETAEEIAFLREQINVCTEDFKQERKDRERINVENERLRDRLAQVERQLMEKDEQINVYQEQIKRLQQIYGVRPVPNTTPVYTGHYHDNEACWYPEDTVRQPEAAVQTRHTHYHRRYFHDDHLPGDVEVDGIIDESQDQPDGVAAIKTLKDTNFETTEASGEELLQCPKCLASFGIDQDADFLVHIDKCVE